jgi:hypothetical protein
MRGSTFMASREGGCYLTRDGISTKNRKKDNDVLQEGLQSRNSVRAVGGLALPWPQS